MSTGDLLIQSITDNIQNLNSNGKSFFLVAYLFLVVDLEHYVDKIGGPDDNEDAKETLNDLVYSSNALSKKTSSLLKELILLSNEQVRFNSQFLLAIFSVIFVSHVSGLSMSI